MRLIGHNVLAIIVAAIAIYAIEFVIFAMAMTQEQYLALSGYTADSMAANASRMPFGAVPPLLAAIGLSLAVKWRNKPGWMAGLTTGVVMAICFGVGISLYNFVYGPNSAAFVGVSLAHFVVCYGAAGAILGAWK
jgi:cytochrome bd-type quinol oxidase subunit 2